jgi:hypothetical protein
VSVLGVFPVQVELAPTGEAQQVALVWRLTALVEQRTTGGEASNADATTRPESRRPRSRPAWPKWRHDREVEASRRRTPPEQRECT